jgi:hypothetical protein
MKQKKIYNGFKALLLLSAMAATVVSCDLDAEMTIPPPSEISPDDYFQTEDQLASYIIYTYRWLPSHDGSGGESFYFDDLPTDNGISGRGFNSRYKPGEWRTGTTEGDWSFDRIRSFNYFLKYTLPKYEAGTITGNASMIKHNIGEAYFLRAWTYFSKLRALGDYPIITEVLPDVFETLVEQSQRAPRNMVARFILEDLDRAIELLSNSPTGGKTRISKNTALLVKSRVALFEGTWEKYHAGTPLVPDASAGWPGASKDYNSGFTYNNAQEVDFFLTQAMSAAEQLLSIPLTTNSKTIQTAATEAANPYYDMFASHDPQSVNEVLFLRMYDRSLGSHWYNHYIYWGANKGYTHQMEQSILMENGLPIYDANSGYAGDDYPEDTKIDRDWRWRLFMKAPNEVKAFLNVAVPEKFEDAPVIFSSDGKTSTSTGYLLGKAYSHDYNDQVMGQDICAAVIFRAGEAYLNYIEACYEKTGNLDSRAQQAWRAIRTRAGIEPDYNVTIDATDINKEAPNDWGAYSHGQLVNTTLYNIRRERRVELIGEGQRYNDLRRWRAMDQLNGFQIEGIKIWGPIKDRYKATDLIIDGGDSKNTVSLPSLSDYLRPLQVTVGANPYYDGYFFCEAHYLNPIANEHFLLSSPDGASPEQSPIYQNPGWTTSAGAPPTGY